MKQGGVCRDYFTKSSVKDRKCTNICGYASVFDIADLDNDIVKKGAFSNIAESKIKFLWQHDSSKPIGVINSLEEDEYGLRIDAQINVDTSFGRDASASVKTGVVDGLSIGYKTLEYEMDYETGYRQISKVELFEVSIVTFPANPDAQIQQVKNMKNEDYSYVDVKLNEINQLIKKLDI